MPFNEEVNRWGDGLADGSDNIEAQVEFVRRQSPPRAAERIEFQCGISAAGDVLRFFAKRFRRARATVPPVRVSSELPVALPAPQVIDGLIACLPDNVPARN